MADFLLELLSEEIPARMQAKARNDLARLFAEATGEAGLTTGAVETHSTPRRLVLIARGVADATESGHEEIKGPRVSAAPNAIEGFLGKHALHKENLVERDGIYFAIIEWAGQPAAEVLPGIIKRIIADFPWPKSMRWGSGTQRWVRPLHGIVAMLGEAIVPVEVDGIASGATTVGHRFHHPGDITVGGASDYVEKLRACHVIVDQDERERLIREGVEKAAGDAGLAVLPDEGLVVENAGLTEWPVPLVGRFDPDYLDVPSEVIVLTMRTNQKYFACAGEDGGLAPAFVCIANIAANDGGAAIAQGNARVLAARLADARFFWEQDLKVPLEEQAQKLGGIVFHEKLGTVADKVERVAKLARWLVEEGIIPLPVGEGAEHSEAGEVDLTLPQPAAAPSLSQGRGELADQAERAARLAKADLVTGMVGEFPELQGVVGGYLAEAQGEPKAVADAIRDHYKPVGQGDDVPTAPVTVALALADKLDTIGSFFFIDERPSGSKDPFAIRRAALAAISIMLSNEMRLGLRKCAQLAMQPHHRAMIFRTIAALKVQDQEVKFTSRIRDELERGVASSGEYEAIMQRLPKSEQGADQPLVKQLRWIAAKVEKGELFQDFVDFFADRLKVQQREAGVRHDLIDAVFAVGGEDDLVRLLARVKALQGFVETEDGTNLLVAYKRAANILRKEKWDTAGVLTSDEEQGIPQTGEEDPLSLVDDPIVGAAIAEIALGEAGADLPQEKALIAALDAAEPTAAAAVEAEDFTGAMAALASLRTPIDAFFDHVTVNDPDAAKRERRLNLLLRFRDAVNRVADFSKVEG